MTQQEIQHSIQEWLGFALVGISLFAAALLPALPSGADVELAMFGVLLLFAGGTAMFITSPTVITELHKLEQATRDALGLGDGR
jgi:hypothetical protein